MALQAPKKRDGKKHGSTISVAGAKSNFSSLLDGVAKKQTPVTILRRGLPIAQLVPVPGAGRREFIGSMKGTGQILGDIVNPYLEEWTVRSDD